MVAFNMPSAPRTVRGPAMDWRAVAIRAVGFVSSNRSQLDRFLASAGISRTEFQKQPVATSHLTAILDFLITDEPSLKAFSRTVDLPLEAAYEARRALVLGKGQAHGAV